MKRHRPNSRPAPPPTGAGGPTELPDRLLLDALFEHLPDCIYFKDRAGHFLRVSRFLAMRSGRRPDALRGLTDRDLFTEEHAQQAADDEARILDTGTPLIGKVEKETWPDGSSTWVSSSKLPLHDAGGRVLGIFGISRDITEQHLANEQLARMAQQLRERNEDYERDLKLAGEVFAVFAGQFPPALPPGAGPGQARITCACHYRPAARLGGDFHLLLPLPGGWQRVLLCDVMGHGVQAALVAVLLRSWAQEYSESSATPSRWIGRLNRQLADTFLCSGTPVTATAFACDLHPASGRIRYCRAGHPTPMLVRARNGRIERLAERRACGPGMGIMPQASYHRGQAVLERGDKLVMFTDGLPEARNAAQLEFEEAGILRALRDARDADAARIVQQVLQELAAHVADCPPDDDICVLVFERHLASASHGS